MDLEEEQKRQRVRDILARLEASYQKAFNKPLDRGFLRVAIEHTISDLEVDMIKETLSHLIEKHSFDLSDLHRLSDAVSEVPISSLEAPSVETRKRGRKSQRPQLN